MNNFLIKMYKYIICNNALYYIKLLFMSQIKLKKDKTVKRIIKTIDRICSKYELRM